MWKRSEISYSLIQYVQSGVNSRHLAVRGVEITFPIMSPAQTANHESSERGNLGLSVMALFLNFMAATVVFGFLHNANSRRSEPSLVAGVCAISGFVPGCYILLGAWLFLIRAVAHFAFAALGAKRYCGTLCYAPD